MNSLQNIPPIPTQGATSNKIKKSAIEGINKSSDVASRIQSQNSLIAMKDQKSILSPQKAKGPARITTSSNKVDLVDGPRAGAVSAATNENNLFNKHYNKELKLCEDEIPMVLCELNESALAYLNRDQFENALLLLQKAHGVLDVVDLTNSNRDQQISLQLFHNMAMCYQKQGQLEECALCLETTLDHMGKDYANLKFQSFAMRIYKLKMEARLRLQFCAILSQLHRHKEALEQACEGIKISHLIVRDKIAVCRYYSRRIDLKENEPNHGGSSRNQSFSQSEQTKSGGARKGSARPQSRTKKHKKDQYSVGGAVQNDNRGIQINSVGIDDQQSKSSFQFDDDDNQDFSKQYGNGNDSRLNQDDNISDSASLGQYQTKMSFYNNLEGSISLIEKTGVKLLPIFLEVLKKIKVIEQKEMVAGRQGGSSKERDDDQSHDIENIESSDIDSKMGANAQGPNAFYKQGSGKKLNSKKMNEKLQNKNNVDLRHILGFLNQTEWIQNLNIGNIMQIAPIRLDELTQTRRNEDCLARESFLDVISFLIVGYFCASTEIRFIIQLKDEIGKFPNFQIEKKTQESELWHTMSLDIACSFLPSDCPLLNHILLSYQKHHAPSQTQIPEDSTLEEKLRVIKPLTGIDNSRYQPIIRELQNTRISLPLSQIQPAQKTVTKLVREMHKGSALAMGQSEEMSQAHLKYFQGVSSGNGQQQSSNTSNPQMKKHQVYKLLKLEKLIGKFSKEIGFDKQDILRMLLGQQNRLNQNELQFKNGLYNQPNSVQSLDQNGERPKSQQDSMSQRQQLDSINTGIAAKIAYNNIGKYNDSQDQLNNQQPKTMVANKSQGSLKSQNSQGGANWRMSPKSYMESRNGATAKSFSNHSDEREKSATLESDAKEKANGQGSKFPRHATAEAERLDKSHRTAGAQDNIMSAENTFLNDLSAANINHHDKSFNEQLDDRSKFVLNQNEINTSIGSQHHNLSIGTIGNSQSHGGTVRQSNKRTNSQERGSKMQRPRSSKGYRGGQFASNQNHISGAGHSSLTSANISNAGPMESLNHQMSANVLPSGASSSNLGIHSSGQPASGIQGLNNQKIQMSKSEERNLKTQQNTRSILSKGQRQKTAGGGQQNQTAIGQHFSANHTANNGFPKDSVNSKSTLASLSNVQSQSSSQLPSAMMTANFQKLSKKQMQQIQSQQAILNSATANSSTQQSSQQILNNQAASLANYNTYTSISKSQKKQNIEDLKKFLLKEYGPAQAQLILQQHIASGGQGPSLQQLEQIQNNGRSSASGKSKKLISSNIGQISTAQGPQSNNNNSSQMFDKLDNLQVNLDIMAPNMSQQNFPNHNKDLKELIQANQRELLNNENDQGGQISLQQKKAKQILAQARKQSANNGPSTQNHNSAQQQPISSHQKAQQIYINSLQSSIGAQRPGSSSQNQVVQKSGQSSSNSRSGQNQNREVQSKSSLGTHGGGQPIMNLNSANNRGNSHNTSQNNTHQMSQPLLQQNHGSAANPSNSLKRREKGRLIMQEWLTKSNPPQGLSTNGVQGPIGQGSMPQVQQQHNQSSQQLLGNQQQQNLVMVGQSSANTSGASANAGQPTSATVIPSSSSKKFVQGSAQALSSFNLSSAQLTKFQQQQLNQIQQNNKLTSSNSNSHQNSSNYDGRRKSNN